VVRGVALDAVLSVIHAVSGGLGPWLGELVAIEDDQVLLTLSECIDSSLIFAAAKRSIQSPEVSGLF